MLQLPLSHSVASGKPSSLLFIRNFNANSQGHVKLVGRYTTATPVELFRIQGSKRVSLREFSAQMAKNRISFDVKQSAENGLILPMTSELFVEPNGMSMRPLGPVLHEIVRTFRGGKNVTIFRIPAGTQLEREALQLLHEHSDHFSLQCSKPMTLSDLNQRLTDFLHKYGEQLTRHEFCQRYPYTSSFQ